jgi:hypothetical protein
MTAIGRIVRAVTGSPAPVVFLDSCTLLDVVRAPSRNNASEVQFARLFLTSVQKAPKAIHLIIGSPTQTEWNDHIDKTESECANTIDCCNAVAAVCGYMAMTAPAPLPLATGGLPAMLRQLSADLLAAAVAMDNNAAAMNRAINRVIASQLPARKGGTGAKDAVIVEHVVETTAQLRAFGFGQPCVFVSSNTKDFAAPSSTNLNPALLAAFTPVNLLYATSLTHAESILTPPAGYRERQSASERWPS